MKEMLAATGNWGKLLEIRNFLSEFIENIRPASDFPGFPEVIEDGETFEQNALKKARAGVLHTGLPALADDSGLVVDALDGRPGVLSARFAGEKGGDAANNAKLLSELASVAAERRTAAFVCAMAFVTPEGEERIFTGRIGGKILFEPIGGKGFGYDPLFLPDGFDRTMAELEIEEKNRISHRGEALDAFREFLSGKESLADEN